MKYKRKGSYGKAFEEAVLSKANFSLNTADWLGYTITKIYYPDLVIYGALPWDSTHYPQYGNPIYVEIKTYLDADDEAKMKAVKNSHPYLEIRFVFKDASKKMPHRKMTHGEWATKYGFPWAEGHIPEEWLHELD